MHLHTRNVNTAFRQLVTIIRDDVVGTYKGGVVKRPSRQGNVLMIDEPVTITYSHPRERVLFNATRDANPFFHLYQSLWMLAGRNDVAPLAYYASKNKDFSDDGKTLNGAYGYRWRHAKQKVEWQAGCQPECDQLDVLVNHLKADPTSRRAVLQMWNVEDDLLKIGSTLTCNSCSNGHGYAADVCDECGGKCCKDSGSKDVCCNLSVMFSLRKSDALTNAGGTLGKTFLDMTVTNRSNDMVWGMLGTDYVDFTILQEYMAARLGVEVGKYHHFTNNLHVYDWNWKPEKWLAEGNSTDHYHQEYKKWKGMPLVKDPAVFERELPAFVEQYNGENEPTYNTGDWDEPFLDKVAGPMLRAFRAYKLHLAGPAMIYAHSIKADDWRLAAKGWLERRVK